MINVSVSPTLLIAVFAALLAIIFDWFPPVANWYNELSELKKKQVMVAGLAIVVAAVYGSVCANIIISELACDKAGLSELIYMGLLAAGINQGVHNLTKPSGSVSTETIR